MNLDDTLAVLAADPFADVDVAEINLHLAADADPRVDVAAYLARLDDLADEVAPRLCGDLEARVAEFAHFLFVERGFGGNSGNYYDPRNSYLNAVLDRRLGIPISLSVLAMAVGGRCGMTVLGVGLPGHFIAKALDGDEEVLFDPFNGGQLLDYGGCERLVSEVAGYPFAAHDDTLAAAPPGVIVQRMLNNLKVIHLKAGEYDCAAGVIRRLVQLVPDDPSQRRDLGVSLIHAGKPGQAMPHLEAYLTAATAAEDAEKVRKFLGDARKQVAKWN